MPPACVPRHTHSMCSHIHTTTDPRATQVNIIHDFVTREEIARGSLATDGGGLATDPKAVPDKHVGAAVVDCR
jgi:hypothetical protein